MEGQPSATPAHITSSSRKPQGRPTATKYVFVLGHPAEGNIILAVTGGLVYTGTNSPTLAYDVEEWAPPAMSLV